ncbi:MAG: arginine--tRNA ligase [archaeon]
MKDLIVKELAKHVNLDKQIILNSIEIPPSSELGDFSFPCFALSKELKKNPMEISKELANKIKSGEFEKVEAKGPYVNFFLNKKDLAEKTLKSILKEKAKYGSSKSGKGKKVMIEFSQANTHKAFHVGHIRGTSLGESIARLMEFNSTKVIRANYQGDTGMHVAKWLWCYKKYHSNEKLKEDESWIASIYVEASRKLAENPLLQDEVNVINQQLELGKDKPLMKLWKESRSYCLKAFENIYSELNTHFDKYYFEREFEILGKEIALDLVTKGIAKISDDATIMNLEEDGLSVWVLLRKDGTVLYSSKDLALAEKKFKDFKLDQSINIVADEQNLHFKQLFRTLELKGFKDVKKCKHIPFGLVRLPTGKMSSRTGENILYSSFLDELKEFVKIEITKREKLKEKELEQRALAIAISSLKYSMLKQSSNNIIIFNKEEALDLNGNTGPYLLYSYARAKNILKKAKYKSSSKLNIKSLSAKEKELIIKMQQFPEVVNHAHTNLSPNLIANYSFELAQLFNEFYQSEQVIGSENESVKLVIVDSFAQVLKNALNLLGIETLERM